jgi:hypothetical protein
MQCGLVLALLAVQEAALLQQCGHCVCMCVLCPQVAARDGHVGCEEALQALQGGDDELLKWVEYQMFTPAYTRCVQTEKHRALALKQRSVLEYWCDLLLWQQIDRGQPIWSAQHAFQLHGTFLR